MTLFSVRVVQCCQGLSIPFALENPASSSLFCFETLLRALHSGPCFYVILPMCEYGEPWQKYTTLATSVQPLQALGCGCSHKSHAVRLRGQVQVKKHDGTARYVDRTALAGAYPVKLVNLYADVISQHVKLHCDDLKFIQTAWSASLRNLVDRKAQATLPRCQRVGHPIQ